MTLVTHRFFKVTDVVFRSITDFLFGAFGVDCEGFHNANKISSGSAQKGSDMNASVPTSCGPHPVVFLN